MSASEPVLSRRILLRGDTGLHVRAFLAGAVAHAAGMQETILQTDTPIGQLWKAPGSKPFARSSTFVASRTVVVASVWHRRPAAVAHLSDPQRRPPMGLIVEKFPATYFGTVRVSRMRS